jgi:hypothetical protein
MGRVVPILFTFLAILALVGGIVLIVARRPMIELADP